MNTLKKSFTGNCCFSSSFFTNSSILQGFLQIAIYLSNKHIWQTPFHKAEKSEILFFHNKLEETEKQLGTNTATFSLSKVQRILNAIFLPLCQHPKRTKNMWGDCCEEEGLKSLRDGGGLSSVWNCCLLITKCVMRYSYIYQSPTIVLNCIIRI